MTPGIDRQRSYPEIAAGGFSRVDGTVLFYTRVRALLAPGDTVLNLGAGRGQCVEDPVAARRDLQDLRSAAGRVIGLDVDDVVLGNPTLTDAAVLTVGEPLCLDDASVDLVLSDFAFEHITDAEWAARQLDRVLRPGGWICARTPNRWGYIGVSARAVPHRFHDQALLRLQPQKKAEDTFPVAYRMNTTRALRACFPSDRYTDCSYLHDSEPAYAGRSALAWRLFQGLHAVTPPPLRSMRHTFLHKQGGK